LTGAVAALLLQGTGVQAAGSSAVPTALPTVQAEVAALLDSLEASGCRFLRNGSWHSGADARAHLWRKWQHMQSRHWQGSTEAFIEQGASRSSTTGQEYRVQCGDAAPQASQAWLLSRLRVLRGHTARQAVPD
jgi:hypothetical protein